MRTVFASLLILLLLATIDTTLTGVIAPTLVAELGGRDQVELVVVAYALASTLTLPLWGRAGDLRGHKRVLLAALVLFEIGSAACAAAQDMPQLVAARAVQGVGAGGLMVGVITVVAALVPPRERARYQGYVTSVTAVAMVGGPLAGGLLTDALSWRWAYLVNLPLGGVAFVALALLVRLPPPAREGRARRPADYLAVLPPRLLAVRNFALAAILAPLQGAVMLSSVTYLPLHLQAGGGSAAASGVLLLPLLAGSVAASFLSGRVISATGRYKPVLVAGTSLVAVGAAGTALTGAGGAVLAVLGVGSGMLMQLVTLVAQNSVPVADVGVASGAGPFLRQLGGVAGVTMTGALYEAGSVQVAFTALTAVAVAAVVVAALVVENPLRVTTG
ncbi:MDR family MFS transporter [Actinomadura kijaniata]|uniref:MFS family permease n=1 Tax=Actinomadura namibiensis TaxID=182080 RepID=A0A7W3QMW0_ACTNM|nr:MDR family MFS transporter [Actinomadura namibiensis]MBA8952949.1 MFS family permease [Actinomadura namibiensis]